MKLKTFISQQLIKIAQSEMSNLFTSEHKNLLFKKIVQLVSEGKEYGYDKLLRVFENDPELSSMKTLIWNISELLQIEAKYGNLVNSTPLAIINDDLRKLDELLQNLENNKLIPYFWILCKKESYAMDECFKCDLAEFYEHIFSKYSFLINLDDFLEQTDLLNYNLIIGNTRSDFFIPVFQRAISKFPNKNALKKILSVILFHNQKYDDALYITKSICDLNTIHEKLTVEKNEDNFYYYDYLESMQLIALCYEKHGQKDMAIKYVNFVLDYTARLASENKEQNDVFSYMDCYLMRMRDNLYNGLSHKVLSDFEEIKGFLDLDSRYWYKEYADVFDMIEKTHRLL